ncbi:MAG: hypothetical protein R3C15_15740 [Thermoleophilia bacterium]
MATNQPTSSSSATAAARTAVALWLGNGLIVQCSASGGGSNVRPLAGYVTPTGWVRWNLSGRP